jgi:DNA-binding transcriptional LysR family regulator
MLSTPLLRTFLAVIEAGNYSAAAERLHLSQPAVTQQIRALEEQLGGVRLFRREGRQMILTVAGEELQAAARELVTLAERAAQQIAALRGQLVGRIAVGCPPGSIEYLWPQLAALLQRDHSAVSLELTVAPADELLEVLLERRLALVISDEVPRSRRIDSRLLAVERLVPVLAAGHPAAAAATAADLLAACPAALPQRGTPARRSIDDALRRQAVAVGELRTALESDSPLALLSAVRTAGCLAYLPAALTVLHAAALQVAVPPLLTAPQEWYLLRTRDPAAAPVQLLANLLFSAEARQLLQRLGLQPAGDGIPTHI